MRARVCRLAGLALLSACLSATHASAQDKLLVYAFNYPLQYFAARIAGERADVRLGGSAASHNDSRKPDAQALHEYRRADLVLLNDRDEADGLEAERLPRHRLVDTSASFSESLLPRDSASDEDGARPAIRSGAAPASFTWLDFYQAAQQAEAVMHALGDKRPQFEPEFERRYRALREELLDLDLQMQRLAARDPAKPLFVAQPSYAYLARRYELRLQSVDWQPQRMPADQDWEQLRYDQEAFPATWMLWGAAPMASIVERLNDMDVEVVLFRTCDTPPLQGDFMAVMRENLRSLARVFPAPGSQ